MQLENMTVTELVSLQTDIRRVLKQQHRWFEQSRPDWDTYFTLMTQVVAMRGACCRRRVGAVLVDKDHRTLSTGYNGKAAGLVNCLEVPCEGAQGASGADLCGCEAVHAEVNALIRCADVREVHTAYVTCSPCVSCVNILLGTGCQRIVFVEAYAHSSESERRWKASGRQWLHWTPEPAFGAQTDACAAKGACACTGQ